MVIRQVLLIASLFCSVWMPVSQAANDNPSTTSIGAGPVIELYTSHGCSSCPPADVVFGDLIAENANLVALEFHVDYWDTLVHGSAGAFVDPFSDPDNTLRQTAYNRSSMKGRRGVYTPQMIVNGSYAAVGTQERFIRHSMSTQAVLDFGLHLVDRDGELSIDMTQVDADSSSIKNTGVWLAVFDIEKTTEITAGENKSLQLTNHHIVREFRHIGRLDQFSETVSLRPELQAGQGCAVLVQSQVPGKIYGAANCPKSMWN